MAESAFHQEARRRQRVIERKREALKKLSDGGVEGSDQPLHYSDGGKRKTSVLFTSSGNFETHRSVHPWIGTERDKRQYDHSRNGPLLSRTWYELRRELGGIGQVTPLHTVTDGKMNPTNFQDLQQVRVITPQK